MRKVRGRETTDRGHPLAIVLIMPELGGVPVTDVRRNRPWWKRHHPILIAWIAAIVSLLGALASLGGFLASWWSVHVAQQAIIAEHRPVLEITSFEFMNKSTLSILGKNSGRSAALTLRGDMWCGIGKYGGGFPPVLKVEKSIRTALEGLPDVPTGATFQMTAPVPGEGWFNQQGAQYTDESSLRLWGILRYQDADHHQFELPWCYESFQPKSQEKPGVSPCYDVPNRR